MQQFKYILLGCILFVSTAHFSCTNKTKTNPSMPEVIVKNYLMNQNHENPRMRFKLIDSRIRTRDHIWKSIKEQLEGFKTEDYRRLYPLIYEQGMAQLQASVDKGTLSYESITKWYLYRILVYESDPNLKLNAIIAINPNAVEIAKQKDRERKGDETGIYGLPILAKDNINTKDMPTTAGAQILMNHQPKEDAFIIQKIKEKGGIILGKTNLSEWAYYLCEGCPLGYSAVGGQGLNPYGRGEFETGGSSSGSGNAIAMNYAVAAIGTETSGSILSPSSQNSLVGMKPTIGRLSRTGIIPISSTLDTPGPMARTWQDLVYLLGAMEGHDTKDFSMKKKRSPAGILNSTKEIRLGVMRLGVDSSLLQEPLLADAVSRIRDAGVEIIEYKAPEMSFDGFLTFLNADLKKDLPAYLEEYASEDITARTVKDIVEHNLRDTTSRIPYGQSLFEGIVAEDISEEDFEKLKDRFKTEARSFFDIPMEQHSLTAVLSINNWNAGHAAMAQYPAITMPMGYKETGEPINLTIISSSYEEMLLWKLAEQIIPLLPERVPPEE